MSARLFEVIAPDEETAVVRDIARNHGADDVIVGAATGDGRRVIRIAVGAADRQALLDSLQMALSGDDKWRIIILPVEATVPRIREDREADEAGEKTGQGVAKRKILSGMTREELSAQLSGGAELDGNFLLLVALSVVVAAIGLIQNNVAVVIGAMVIAPLLGPNLALAFGGAVGAKSLMVQAMRTNLVGIGFTLLLSIGIGWLVGPEASSEELMARTRVDLAGVALALASGAAAALSLTNGLSSTLVGVMVAKGVDGSRVAVTGAGADGVFRLDAYEAALNGSFTPESLDIEIAAFPEMLEDIHGSAGYRAHLVQVMAKRAVAGCLS